MAHSRMISLADPMLGEMEKQVLAEVIDSGWLTMGTGVARFEREFAAMHGVPEALAVNSCTAGLHLCLAGLHIGPGDEVLVPSLTFVATINAVLYVGATPVFVDIIDGRTPHISLDDADGKRTKHSRAVIVMHYGGYAADMQSWREFADRNRLHLIEDAAHAPGLAGVGQYSDACAFSFFANKNMTTGEGGMVFARDSRVLAHMRSMRSHGMTTGTLDRHRGHAYSYDVLMLGYNYRLDELRAALGVAQLARLAEWNERRWMLSGLYRRLMAAQIPSVSVPFEPDHPSVAHLMPILLPEWASRMQVMASLRNAGIQTSIHYPPVHGFRFYRERFQAAHLSQTEAYCGRELTLPLHPGLTEADVRYVVRELAHVLTA